MFKRPHDDNVNGGDPVYRFPRNWLLFVVATAVIHLTQVTLWKGIDMDVDPSLQSLGLKQEHSIVGLGLNGQTRQDDASAATRSLTPQKEPGLCANVPFEQIALQRAIDANDLFHKLGGNLKSVQRFRDQAIDDTLKRLSLEFVPEGNRKPVSSLTSFLNDYYNTHYDPRGGYGRPLPGQFVRKGQAVKKKADGIPELFIDRWIEPIEDGEGQKKWDASLGPIGPDCPKLMQLGDKSRDGYKFYCPSATEGAVKNGNKSDSSQLVAQQQRKTTAAADQTMQDNVACHIVSVGGNDNWKFEVAAADALGCIIHTFDCTLPDNTPKRKPERDDIKFYPHCLDGTTRQDTHGRPYVSYPDLLALAGINEAPRYFKIDVEGFEYDIFQQMIEHDHRHGEDKSGSLLPQQIQVELHWATRMTGVEWMPRTRSSGEVALLSGMMYLGGGYLPIHLDFNPHCSTCMEVLYYKTIC